MQIRRVSWLRHIVGSLFMLMVLITPVLTDGEETYSGGGVFVLQVDDAIGPATADYIHRGLRHAVEQGGGLVVIEMDTPGGLDTSMRLIVKDILASPIPVATFVSPSGSRAASAGTYILYASHIAAMAPATNLGAATPVAIGIGSGHPDIFKPAAEPPVSRDQTAQAENRESQTPGSASREGSSTSSSSPVEPKPAFKPALTDTLGTKSVEDATGYIRSLAQLRGRNIDFAVRAVREAASLSSQEALAQHVIDLIAVDLPDLLAQLNGREVALRSGKVVLATADVPVERLVPDWRNRILAVLANPQVALVLMLIGICGLFFEFILPGAIAPGVFGSISLLVALYAFQMLPVNWVGVLLLAMGAALMLAETFIPSFGALGIGGLIAFIVGGILLTDTQVPGFGVPPALIIGLALVGAVFLLAIGSFVARSVRRPVVSGREEMVGARGTVIGPVIGPDAEGKWWVMVHGERWRACSAALLKPGDKVRVDGLEGLILDVSPSNVSV